ncbi:MAG: Uma2 family endonuclease [Chloroflexota bacterium]
MAETIPEAYMALPQQDNPRMSRGEYLEFERNSDERHEYIHGRVYAMAGASEPHNQIVFNLSGLFWSALRKRPCKAYAENMAVQAGKNYVYPDLVAVCGEAQIESGQIDTLTNPQVVIEVLSPSTQRYDKELKAMLYRQTPSIQEILLVSQTMPAISRYVRQENDVWTVQDTIGVDAAVKLAALDVTLALADVYEKVTFPDEDEA